MTTTATTSPRHLTDQQLADAIEINESIDRELANPDDDQRLTSLRAERDRRPVVTITRDPWNPDATPTAHVVHPCADCGVTGCAPRCEARRDRAADQPCRCGYDLCGECMAVAHAGGTPTRLMTVPGLFRAS